MALHLRTQAAQPADIVAHEPFGDTPFVPANDEAPSASAPVRAGRWWGKRAVLHPLGGAPKRVLDILLAAIMLALLAPVLAVVWGVVRLESPGPGFFRQHRGGFRGRPFSIYKFRTMAVCENSEITQAVRSDPRVTRVGAFLRKTSIDELPQLFNVLIGDMSLVGPRPHALAHDDAFAKIAAHYRRRFRARPGITGLAQVSGSRGPTDTSDKIIERANLDAAYVEGWSIRRDVAILWKTAALIFQDPNAF